MNRLPFLLLAVLAAGCGPYDGDGFRAQHQDGVVSQATLDGAPATSPDAEQKEREKRLAKEAERQRRMAEATPEPTPEPAPEPTPKPTPEPVTAVEDPSSPDTTIPPLPSAAQEEGAEPATPRPEMEGNLADLIAEEEARLAAQSGTADETPAPDETGETPDAAVDETADTAATPGPDGPEAAPETDDPFAGSSDSVASLPAADEVPPVASVTGSALPPCDPFDLTSVALRDLSLAQTFGEGETARALLRSSGGKEYVVRRGSVVGPDGARVVKVTPGELILAEIQFDMSGAPVMVRKALRMSVPE